MKRRMRGGRRLALVSFTAVLGSLGPIPAFADEGPLVTVLATTGDAVDATSTTVDDVAGTATTTVDAAPNPADTVVEGVTDTVATIVDPASNAVAGATGSITDAASDVEGSVGASVGSLTQAVTDGTWIGHADPDTDSATAGSSGRAGGSSTHAADSARASSPLPSSGERTISTLADGADGLSRAALDTAPCPDAGAPSCSPTSGTTEEDSLAEKIADVIGELAVTGFVLLPWIVAALVLSILGSVALERGRAARSRARA